MVGIGMEKITRVLISTKRLAVWCILWYYGIYWNPKFMRLLDFCYRFEIWHATAHGLCGGYRRILKRYKKHKPWSYSLGVWQDFNAKSSCVCLKWGPWTKPWLFDAMTGDNICRKWRGSLPVPANTIVRYRYNAVDFQPKSSQRAPHSSPVRARYGVAFVNITYDAYLASIIIVPYAKSCWSTL